MLIIDTSIGKLTLIAKNGFITNIHFADEPVVADANCPLEDSDMAVLKECAKQINEYFAGEREIFTVPIKPKGGEFFQRVWEIMTTDERVGFSKTVTYSCLAELAGSPRACRAVGMANNKNPIPIIIPCHRVMGKGGSLTGFRWGLDVKKALLELENVVR